MTPVTLSKDQAKAELEIDKRWLEQVSARHTQSSMWIIASLFAINGAGVIACSTRAEDSPSGLTEPATAFVVGLLLSLLCGVVARTADRVLIGELRERVRVLAEAGGSSGNGTTEAEERSFAQGKARVDQPLGVVTLLGALAVIAWLVGAVLLAQVPPPKDEPQSVQRIVLECPGKACPQ